MRHLLSSVLICTIVVVGYAQGYNPGYAVNVGVTYDAPQGRIPADIKVTPPAYPFEMSRAAISGEVTFELTVQEDGRVSDIVATKSSHKEFEAAALEALKSWKFRALKDNPGGSPRPLRLRGKISFHRDLE